MSLYYYWTTLLTTKSKLEILTWKIAITEFKKKLEITIKSFLNYTDNEDNKLLKLRITLRKGNLIKTTLNFIKLKLKLANTLTSCFLHDL